MNDIFQILLQNGIITFCRRIFLRKIVNVVEDLDEMTSGYIVKNTYSAVIVEKEEI